jgi:3-phenylpropionate/cinnamic acid dioxygenase small subunit
MSAIAPKSSRPVANSVIDLGEIEQFLFEEARLLDDREFEMWSDLFLDDGFYWVPARPDQESPRNHVSLFYDDKETMQTRIRRLRHPMIHVQIPHSSTIHLVSNIVLLAADEPNDIKVRANFIMFEDRPATERRLFAGRSTYCLRRVGSNLRILLKRVDLTNNSASFPALTLPI